jgi:hypothetical protein
MAFWQRVLEGEKYVTGSLVPLAIYTIRQSFLQVIASEASEQTVKELTRILLNDFDRRYHPTTDGKLKYERDALVGHGNRGSLILKQLPEQLRNHEERWNSLKTPLRSGISNGNKNWSELPARLLPGSRISIIIKPSTLRGLQTILFKSPPLYVEIEFTNKQIQSYKISESTSKHITIYPFVTDNQSLENAFNVIQSTGKKNIALGPKPVKIRLTGDKEMLGINSADLIIEQPLPR